MFNKSWTNNGPLMGVLKYDDLYVLYFFAVFGNSGFEFDPTFEFAQVNADT